jgi:hypothetical protein
MGRGRPESSSQREAESESEMSITYTFRPPSAELWFGSLEDNEGNRWAFTLNTDKWVWTHEGIERPGFMEPRGVCDKCGRADWIEVGPQTFAQAVERGWLVPIPLVSLHPVEK